MMRSNILVAACSAPAPPSHPSAACGSDTTAAAQSKKRRILGPLQWCLDIRVRSLASTGHKLCCRCVWGGRG